MTYIAAGHQYFGFTFQDVWGTLATDTEKALAP